jgi:hypothetical protein
MLNISPYTSSGSYEIEEKKKGENNDKVQYSFNFVKYVNVKNNGRENMGRGGRKSKHILDAWTQRKKSKKCENIVKSKQKNRQYR